jgi:uncharacterized membrane protein YcgQ (UPF0703/DUF1980 family)
MLATAMALSILAAGARRNDTRCIGGVAGWALVGGLAATQLPRTTPALPQTGVITHAPVHDQNVDLFAALARIDASPRSMLGRRISVTGRWMAGAAGRPASVSRRLMTCCAADAVAIGFDVEPSGSQPKSQRWVRVTGDLAERLADGEIRYVLEHATVTVLEDGEREAP